MLSSSIHVIACLALVTANKKCHACNSEWINRGGSDTITTTTTTTTTIITTITSSTNPNSSNTIKNETTTSITVTTTPGTCVPAIVTPGTCTPAIATPATCASESTAGPINIPTPKISNILISPGVLDTRLQSDDHNTITENPIDYTPFKVTFNNVNSVTNSPVNDRHVDSSTIDDRPLNDIPIDDHIVNDSPDDNPANDIPNDVITIPNMSTTMETIFQNPVSFSWTGNPTQQCREQGHLGACRLENSASVCTSLMCFTENSTIANMGWPKEYTICGPERVCTKGECVHNPKAAEYSYGSADYYECN